MKFIYLITTILVLLITPALAVENSVIIGKVIQVYDGDTILLQTVNNEQFRIRLAEIDAPESDQDYGSESKDFLKKILFDENVRVLPHEIDKYGRIVGTVFLNDQNINFEMVKSGSAWAYRRYLKDKELLQLEKQAKGDKRGLWGFNDNEIIEPEFWRHRK